MIRHAHNVCLFPFRRSSSCVRLRRSREIKMILRRSSALHPTLGRERRDALHVKHGDGNEAFADAAGRMAEEEGRVEDR